MHVVRALLLGGGVLLALGTAYREGPPAAHTGGFGEPTCQACHFDGEPNEPGGSAGLRGVPKRYAPGREYVLELVVAHPDVERGGFQLAARFAAGPEQGRQAGTLAPGGAGAAVDVEAGVQYARHTSAARAEGDSVRWTLCWTAPAAAHGPVVFHLAANAANGDDSPFGDFLYIREITSRAK